MLVFLFCSFRAVSGSGKLDMFRIGILNKFPLYASLESKTLLLVTFSPRRFNRCRWAVVARVDDFRFDGPRFKWSSPPPST